MVKNLKGRHYLDGIVPESDIELMEHAAHQHKQFNNIEFKILKVAGDITIKVTQGRNAAGAYHDVKRLVEIVHETFGRFFPGKRLIVHPVPFQESPAAAVDKQWVCDKMLKTGTRLKDLAADTGIDKTQLSRIINPESDFVLSQPMKALFWYYFLAKE